MTNYKIINDSDAFDFGTNVTKHLNEGWQLHGDLHVVSDASGSIRRYCQAVIYLDKTEKKKEPEYLVENIAPVYHPDFQKLNTLQQGIRLQ